MDIQSTVGIKGIIELTVGEKVVNRKFPINIQGDRFSTELTGQVTRIFATRNVRWATIKTEEGNKVICLGDAADRISIRS